MSPDEIDHILTATLEDLRLSRGEKRALGEVLTDGEGRAEDPLVWRSRAFALAKAHLGTQDGELVLGWLEAVIKALNPTDEHTAPSRGTPARPELPTGAISEVHFSPGPSCLTAIQKRIDEAKRTIDLCVFTITDDRMTQSLLSARRRRIRLRVITDGEKSGDLGSDIHRLVSAGIEVRIDPSEHHMHHKFAIFDDAVLVTGSYNWTRSAAEHNQENILVTDAAPLVEPYRLMFAAFWDRIEARSR